MRPVRSRHGAVWEFPFSHSQLLRSLAWIKALHQLQDTNSALPSQPVHSSRGAVRGARGAVLISGPGRRGDTHQMDCGDLPLNQRNQPNFRDGNFLCSNSKHHQPSLTISSYHQPPRATTNLQQTPSMITIPHQPQPAITSHHQSLWNITKQLIKIHGSGLAYISANEG
ncbi:hypothetical protein RRG08_052348 [Elysia crispata]|uniref:Uncharacterized protein n=1 Tax=Elysia crispata TaxID=231223 RepID=A0AAE1A8D1_9GAST|nr:hypothetical protein RRG08_052348 [Elysia crispata]